MLIENVVLHGPLSYVVLYGSLYSMLIILFFHSIFFFMSLKWCSFLFFCFFFVLDKMVDIFKIISDILSLFLQVGLAIACKNLTISYLLLFYE